MKKWNKYDWIKRIADSVSGVKRANAEDVSEKLCDADFIRIGNSDFHSFQWDNRVVPSIIADMGYCGECNGFIF